MANLERQTLIKAGKDQPSLRHCDACGAVGQLQIDTSQPMHVGEIWFCKACLCSLASDEIERLSQEITLRGVPYS
jgi:hypothetical protein